MKVLGWMMAGIFFLGLAGCSRRDGAQVPLGADVASDSVLTLVWNGQGRAFRAGADGAWSRDSTYDYEFTVVQRRDGPRWRSVKTLQRRHPAYDGRAGDRAQTMFFSLDFSPAGDSLASRVASTLGEGRGRSDREFRTQRLEMAADGVGRFAPYNAYHITQRYRYEEGVLEETVELVRRKDGEEAPIMRIEESASIYARTRLPGPPGRM